MRGEYDKAAEVYERILEQDPNNAEAHWGIVLSRYGIEYVEDPVTRRRIPTCNRASYDPIIKDDDYLAAASLSDAFTASLYKKEADSINEIQREILQVSSSEKLYDIFICYKEKDGIGQRTKESLRAQDLYYNLTEAGYRVFFSRITLEDKLGSQYEPYIFSALNSAKVMLVVGSSNDNLNSVWVKNEWSRFLKIMKKDSSKTIIPCYVDMDPYDLPDELAMLQSQDMGKIGFLQDLTRGIRKLLGTEPDPAPVYGGANSQDNPDRMNKTAETYLKLEEYDSAREAFQRMTQNCPEDYRGWWGLIRIETGDLKKLTADIPKLNVWYGYILKLGDPKNIEQVRQEYTGYLHKIADNKAKDAWDCASVEIRAVQDAVERLEQKISTLNSQADECREQLKAKDNAYNSKRRGLTDSGEESERLRGLRKNISSITLCIIVLGLALFLYGGFVTNNGYVAGPGMILIAVGILIVFITNSSLNDRAIENKCAVFDRRAEQMERDHRADRSEPNHSLENITDQISQNKRALSQKKERLNSQKRILEKGKDTLSKEYYFELAG